MRPIDHTLISQIGAPIEKVFAVLSDPARMPEWLPACKAAEAPGPLRKGVKLKVRFGDSRVTEFTIVDYSAPNTLGWTEHGGREGHKTFFRLDFAGGQTAVTIKEVWVPATLAAWFKGKFFPKRDVPKLLDATVQNLRVAVGR